MNTQSQLLCLAALLGISAAAPISSNRTNAATFCTYPEPNFAGMDSWCNTFRTGNCNDMPYQLIQSVKASNGYSCGMYTNSNCAGEASPKITGSGVDDVGREFGKVVWGSWKCDISL